MDNYLEGLANDENMPAEEVKAMPEKFVERPDGHPSADMTRILASSWHHNLHGGGMRLSK